MYNVRLDLTNDPKDCSAFILFRQGKLSPGSLWPPSEIGTVAAAAGQSPAGAQLNVPKGTKGCDYMVNECD